MQDGEDSLSTSNQRQNLPAGRRDDSAAFVKLGRLGGAALGVLVGPFLSAAVASAQSDTAPPIGLDDCQARLDEMAQGIQRRDTLAQEQSQLIEQLQEARDMASQDFLSCQAERSGIEAQLASIQATSAAQQGQLHSASQRESQLTAQLEQARHRVDELEALLSVADQDNDTLLEELELNQFELTRLRSERQSLAQLNQELIQRLEDVLAAGADDIARRSASRADGSTIGQDSSMPDSVIILLAPDVGAPDALTAWQLSDDAGAQLESGQGAQLALPPGNGRYIVDVQLDSFSTQAKIETIAGQPTQHSVTVPLGVLNLRVQNRLAPESEALASKFAIFQDGQPLRASEVIGEISLLLEPGNYHLLVETAGKRQSLPLVVNLGQSLDIDLSVPVSTASLHFVDASGEPVAGEIAWSLTLASMPESEVIAAGSGNRSTFALAQGDYMLRYQINGTSNEQLISVDAEIETLIEVKAGG